jgi:hypothetical protein
MHGNSQFGEKWISDSGGTVSSNPDATKNIYASEWAALAPAIARDNPQAAKDYLTKMSNSIFTPINSNLSVHYGYYLFMYDSYSIRALNPTRAP